MMKIAKVVGHLRDKKYLAGALREDLVKFPENSMMETAKQAVLVLQDSQISNLLKRLTNRANLVARDEVQIENNAPTIPGKIVGREVTVRQERIQIECAKNPMTVREMIPN